MIAKIYSKNDCGWCVKAKNLMQSHNLEVVEFNIEWKPEWKTQLKEDCAKLDFVPKTVPQIWIEKRYIGGYEELLEFIYPTSEF